MVSENSSERESSGRRLKIMRLIDEYGLDGTGDEMERLWTAERDERMSLRDLAEYFNRELLAAAVKETGERPLDGEIENLYRLLTDDDVSEADRTRVRRRLDREGLNVERLQTDFVTYQAVRAYLKEHRGAEYNSVNGNESDINTEAIQRLRGRTATVTQGKLDQLRNTGEITLGEFRTIVGISVICEDCGSQYEVNDLIELGGCDCEHEN